MNCQEREDNIYLHAVGALEGSERAELQAHLATGCAPCSGKLAEATAAVSQIALASFDRYTQVPASAKARLDDRINTLTASEGVQRPERDSLLLRPEPARTRWAPMLLAAAIAAAVTAGPMYLLYEGRNQNLRTQLASAQSDTTAARTELANAKNEQGALATKLAAAEKMLDGVNAQLTALQNQNKQLSDDLVAVRTDLRHTKTDLAATQEVAKMLYSKQLMMVDLKGQPGNPDAQGRLLVDLQNKVWKLYTADLKPVPNRVFEFWLITADGTKVPMGSFTTDASGQATLNGKVPDPLPALASAAITDEPGPGMKQPTGSMHAHAKIQ